MYNEEYFYGITDLMHFNVYASLLKDHIIKEERVIIKVFKKDETVIWKCNNCGFIFEGDAAPERCPACDHPIAHFEVLTFFKG